MSQERFKEILREICDGETSSHKNEWTSENPFLGHCTVVSLLAQDVFGGDILRVDLRNSPGFEDVKWHSWNRLSNGEEVDFTSFSLPGPVPKDALVEVRDRQNLFSYPTVQDRYELLKSRFDKLSATINDKL